jgi:hypothetical protein
MLRRVETRKQGGQLAERRGHAQGVLVLAPVHDLALRSEWDRDLQERALAVVFNGLRPG